jgi:NAD(P)-dependent dehydrogenase (short-subunit alcohol dehydrogenase family)
MKIGLVARHTDKLEPLCQELNAEPFRCDASQTDEVQQLFDEVDKRLGTPDVVVYNPSYRTQGALVDILPADVEKALAVTALGGFLVGQQAAKRMLQNGKGTILFTGASASVKGYPKSAPFAMGKFALRGLVQSMARELAPHNIHVAHFIIDGAILPPGQSQPPDNPDSFLDPDEIAQNYLHVLRQHRSAWTWEVELRPWVEHF